MREACTQDYPSQRCAAWPGCCRPRSRALRAGFIVFMPKTTETAVGAPDSDLDNAGFSVAALCSLAGMVSSQKTGFVVIMTVLRAAVGGVFTVLFIYSGVYSCKSERQSVEPVALGWIPLCSPHVICLTQLHWRMTRKNV